MVRGSLEGSSRVSLGTTRRVVVRMQPTSSSSQVVRHGDAQMAAVLGSDGSHAVHEASVLSRAVAATSRPG